jgi:hypothetical protein
VEVKVELVVYLQEDQVDQVEAAQETLEKLLVELEL